MKWLQQTREYSIFDEHKNKTFSIYYFRGQQVSTPPLGATSEATEEMNPETLSLPTPNHSSTSSSPLNSNPAPKDRDRDPKDRGDASDSKNSPETKGWLYKWTNYIKGKRNKEIIKL